ncbi:splicing regulatory glutamine/lysine-rich protein 1-like [Armigeres subalbatus]|uniref:splicing regulatory glutamine/lysine-rich protein 1-like n=1 Tax=Armigeres subalbatus TaxID=124917 RepID=UPI002ED092BE
MSGPYILPEAEHLLVEEVDFDLNLRGQVVDRRETLEDKQRFLRRLLLEEKKSKTKRQGKHYFKDEVEVISEKVETISAGLSKRLDRVLISRLRHYLIRAHTAIVQTEREEKVRKEICQQIEEVLKSFKLKVFMNSEELNIEKDQKNTETTGDEVGKVNTMEENTRKDKKDVEGEDNSGDELDDRAAEKQKELDEEWKEFILWKQDKIYNEAKERSKIHKAELLETQLEKERKANVDKRPPECNKSRKSRSNYRMDSDFSRSETEQSSDERSPERYKNRKSQRETSRERKKDKCRSDRRPPESNKSRKSHREQENLVKLARSKGDRRPPESNKSRKSRRSVSKESRRRNKRYSSSESSLERRGKDRMGRKSRRDTSGSTDEWNTECGRGHRHRRRSLSSASSEFHKNHKGCLLLLTRARDTTTDGNILLSPSDYNLHFRKKSSRFNLRFHKIVIYRSIVNNLPSQSQTATKPIKKLDKISLGCH